MNPIKKKKKHDYDDEDDRGSKKSKKRRKMDSEEEFINPEDYVEKRRSGRAQRGGRKNYDDNAVPNFSDSPETDDVNLSSPENLLVPAVKKRGRKKKDSTEEGGDQLESIAEVIEDPLIVDKILSHRIVRRKKEEDEDSVKTEPPKTGENVETIPADAKTAEPTAEAATTETPKVTESTETAAETEKPAAAGQRTKSGEEKTEDLGEEEEEFFIKWKGYSYIHCVWLFRDEVFDPRFDQKLRRYFSKLGTNMNAPDPDNEDIFNPEFVIIGKFYLYGFQFLISHFLNFLRFFYNSRVFVQMMGIFLLNTIFDLLEILDIFGRFLRNV